MTEETIKALQQLHADGYAVVVFTPEELEEVEADEVEAQMTEAGWNCIDCLKLKEAK